MVGEKDRKVANKQNEMKEPWAGDTRRGRWGEGRGSSNKFCVIFFKNNFILNFYYHIIKKVIIWIAILLSNNLNYQNNLNYHPKKISNIII